MQDWIPFTIWIEIAGSLLHHTKASYIVVPWYRWLYLPRVPGPRVCIHPNTVYGKSQAWTICYVKWVLASREMNHPHPVFPCCVSYLPISHLIFPLILLDELSQDHSVQAIPISFNNVSQIQEQLCWQLLSRRLLKIILFCYDYCYYSCIIHNL